MKISLITIWHERNYGAELQAYATIKLLQREGHEVELINIRLEDQHTLGIKRVVGNVLRYISPSERDFRKFWDTNFPLSRRYRSLDDLRKNPPLSDCYIVGSDQVWNPSITRDFYPAFFLDFGSNNIKRLSFASSFGTFEWKYPELRDNIKRCLDKFQMITCREESGVNIIRQEFKLDAEQILDPTILLNDYSSITGELEEKDTLVFYPLSEDPELEDYSIKLAHKLHLEHINNKHSEYLLKKIEWKRITISDWVKNIASAKFVITRSFHGTLFSIMFHRQFAVVASKNGKGTRLKNILTILKLQDRYFETINDLDTQKPWEKSIVYDSVDNELRMARDNSFKVINKMLSI